MDPRDTPESRKARGVVATLPKKCCIWSTVAGTVLIAAIVAISLIAASFSNVDEGQACMQYSDYSGKLEEEVFLEPTNKMVGPSSGFHCYPKTIQEIEFAQGGRGVNRILGTRTIEGLFISLDIHIEYRIIPDEMRDLFLKFGPWQHVVTNLTIIARSEIRNTASRYGGLEYLAGDRALISSNMRADLHLAFSRFHVEVSEVNIKSISLSPEFEDAFDAVRQVKLAASKALQTREVDLTQEVRANESAVITLLAERETTLLAASADVTKAALQREAMVTAKQTEVITAKLKAESTRATTLTQARSEVNKAQSERNARLTEARVRNSEQTLQAERSRGVVLIEAATEVEKARTAREAALTSARTSLQQAKIALERDRESRITAAQANLAAVSLSRDQQLTKLQAELEALRVQQAARLARESTLADIVRLEGNTTATSLRLSEEAKVELERAERQRRVGLLQALKSQGGLSIQQVLRYLHLGAVAEVAASDSTTTFVDYKKVPMVLEAQEAAAAAAGTAPQRPAVVGTHP